ncbi:MULTISPECIES: hypothetical protein [Bacillus]|uniref:hypothetical protein n=1 Tax=Bacillus TaxID=1386 RepID=UPI000BB7B69A|nr:MULTISPECIES: hypothetical protein [Bacillus]
MKGNDRMKRMFGIEISCSLESPAYFQNVIAPLKETASIYDVDEQLLILESAAEAKFIKKLLDDKCMLEETYILIRLDNPKIGSSFTDYGFETSNHHYLYEDMICMFKVVSGNKDDMEMALLQMNESIIGMEIVNSTTYIIDKHQKEFIEKVAKAYDIEVSFLVLDK